MKSAWLSLMVLCASLVLAETWTCKTVQSTLDSLSPGSPCIPKSADAAFTQIAAYSVWVHDAQDGSDGAEEPESANGDGFCAAIGNRLPVFSPTVQAGSSSLWSVTVTNYEPVWTGTQITGYTVNTTHTTPVTLSIGACTCVSSDCSNPAAAGQCTETCTQCGPPPPPPTTPCSCAGQQWKWEPASCSYVCESGSPIILDVDGSGWNLTDAAHGVSFDFFGDTYPTQMSWTASGSTNAWLVLDRNHNGLIDSGLEMFGNLTPQPPGPDRNGFRALAVFDVNHDGVIDTRDPIFSDLRLWQDINHDGISQPSELHSLPELGVAAIDLNYQEVPYVDQCGNRFRYRARVSGGLSLGRWTYDVFLTFWHPGGEGAGYNTPVCQ